MNGLTCTVLYFKNVPGVPAPVPMVTSFNNVVDADISMYDEIMVSSTSVPDFRVTLSYNPLESANDDFSVWWNSNKKDILTDNSVIKHITITSDPGILASGIFYEYSENREDFSVELIVRSALSEELDEHIGWNEKRYDTTISNTSTLEHFVSILQNWLQWVWHSRAEFTTPIEISPGLFQPIGNIIRNKTKDYAFGDYTLRIRTSFTGTRKTLMKQISMFLNAKIIYLPEKGKFRAIPFRAYENNPTIVTGYVSDEGYDRTEQSLEEITLFNYVRTYSTGGQRIDSFKNSILRYANNNLRDIVFFKRYRIWGHSATIAPSGDLTTPGKIIHTGETIRLNGIDYYVQDISYDFERLNDLKTFEAECVRFVV